MGWVGSELGQQKGQLDYSLQLLSLLGLVRPLGRPVQGLIGTRGEDVHSVVINVLVQGLQEVLPGLQAGE